MSRYEPNYEIEFARNKVTYPIRHKVTSFSFEDSAQETDVVTIVLEDVHTDLIDHPALLDDGNTTLYFRFGYIGDMSEKHKATITSVKPMFPDNGIITLEIKAHDIGMYAKKDVRTKVWERPEGYRPDELAIAVANDLGLYPVVEKCAEKTRKLRWSQSKETDLGFLKRVAKQAIPEKAHQNSTYLVYIKNDSLYFTTKETTSKAQYTFTYFPNGHGDLLSFSPEIQENKESTATESRSVSGGTTRNDTSNTSRTSLGKSDITPDNQGILSSPSERRRVDVNTGTTMPTSSSQERNTNSLGKVTSSKGEYQSNPFSSTKTNAQADKSKNSNEQLSKVEKTYTARASVIGTPGIKSNTLIKVNNVGKKFGGYWWVKSVSQNLDDSGFKTDLDLQRDAIGSKDGSKDGRDDGTVKTPPKNGGGKGGGGNDDGDKGGSPSPSPSPSPKPKPTPKPKCRVVVDPKTGESWEECD